METTSSLWAHIDGRSPEHPVGNLNSADQPAAAEAEEKQWRQSRRLQTSETEAPSMAFVPTLSYDFDASGTSLPTAVATETSTSTSSEGIEPTPSPAARMTFDPGFGTTAPTAAAMAGPYPIPTSSPSMGAYGPTLTLSPAGGDDDETHTSTPAPIPAPTPSPIDGDDDDDGGEEDDDEEDDDDGGGDDESTEKDTYDPTPAPVQGTEVSVLTGFLGAPTAAFESTSSFSEDFRDYLGLEDQDMLILSNPFRRRARRLNLPGEFDNKGGARSQWNGSSGMGKDDRNREYNIRSLRGLAEDDDDEEEESTTSTREFKVAFINDFEEWTAYIRGVDAIVLLVEGHEKIAEVLNTTEESITFSDVYYIAPADADFSIADVESTFFGGDSSITGTAAGLAVAFMIALVVVTSCLGVAICKCLLVEDRKRRIARRRQENHRQEQLQPAYERMPPDSPALNPSMPPQPSASYSSSKGYASLRSGGGGLKGNGVRSATASGLGSSSSKQRGGDDDVDVDVGAAAAATAAAMAAAHEERDPFLYGGSESSGGGMGAGASLGAAAPAGGVGGRRRDKGGRGDSGSRRSIGSGSAGDEGYEAGEELMEHDYGDSVQTESFVDGVDGVYSEYDGQSEFDPVVPGVAVNDVMLSEAGSSSRFYYDEGQMSEWSTDLSSQQDTGSFPGFPLRQGSSRFSAGPRSQASFAAPSVAASGGSALSSVVPSSRANFPPASGGGCASPPIPAQGGSTDQQEDRGFHAVEGIVVSSADVTPAATPLEEKGGDDGDGGLVIGHEKVVVLEGRRGGARAGASSGAKQEQERTVGREKGKEPEMVEITSTEVDAVVLEKGAKNHDGEDDREKETGTAIPVWPSAGSIGAASAGAASGATSGAVGASAASLLAGAADSDADVSSAHAPHPRAPPEFSGSAGAGLPVGGGDDGDISPSSSLKGRPSLDSDAGSIAMSSVVAFAKRGASAGSPPDSTVAVVESESAPKAQGVLTTIGGGGGGRVDGQDDDDAGSRYAGSSVANEPMRRQEIGGTGAGGLGRDSASSRPTRIGGSTATGEPMGRNSQSIGGMSAADSSHDSDRESFVSRVESYALTDIGGVGEGQDGTGSQGGRGNGGGGVSPTSTVVRSTGMSELGTERDSYGSDVFTTGSDSPGAHSGWERAWMRQREDARHFDNR